MASTLTETTVISVEQNLKMVRGRKVTYDVVVQNPLGAAVNLTGGTLRFTVKWSPYDADNVALFQKSSPSTGIVVTDATNGKATITISASDTTSAPQHRADLFHSLQFTDSGSAPVEVFRGLFTILPNVTITTP